MPTPDLAVHEEDCAPRRVLELFSVKWTSVVLHALHDLHGGACRTGALQRSLPGISKKMLTQTLREMERDGLLSRRVYQVVPPRVEYSLTPLGESLRPIVLALKRWGENYLEQPTARKRAA
jgi:DNA-binding HxlR family transcriptional regulator